MSDNLDSLLAQLNIQRSPGSGGGDLHGSNVGQSARAPDNLDRLLASRGLSPSGDGQSAPPAPATTPSPGGNAAEPAPSADSTGGSAIMGAVDTLTSGFGDELGGALATVLPVGSGQEKSVWSSGKGFSDTLSSNIAYERAQMKADEAAHPYARMAGQVGGAFLIPFGAGAKGALQVARAGAIQGAAYGLGSGDGVGDRLGEAAAGAVGGAATATVLHPLIAGVGALGRKLLGRGAKAAEGEARALSEDEGDVLVGRVTGEGPSHPQADPTFTPEEQAAGLTGEVTDTAPTVPSQPPTATAWTNPDVNGDRQPVAGAEALAPTPAGDETIPLHAAGTPEAPEGEPVGSISRAGLQDLQSQVEHFRNAVGEEGGRAVDITPGDPAHADLGAFRLGNLGDGPEPMSLLGALTRQLDGLPKLSDQEFAKQVQAAAGDLAGGDHEALGLLANQIAGPGGRPDLAIGVLRTVQRKAAESLDLFHGAGIDWSTASDEMVHEATQSIYNLQKINELVQSAKVGAGRALRVFSLPNSEDYLAAVAKGESLGSPLPDPQRAIPPLPATRQELADHFELWGMTRGDPALQSALLQGTLAVPTSGQYLRSSFANFFTANILSSSRTVLLNVVGPTVINSLRAMEKMAGSASLAMDPSISAAERAQYAATLRDTPMALFHTIGDVADAFRYGVQAFKENHTVIGGGGTVADANVSFGPYNSNLLRAAGADPDWKYTLGNVLNIWPKAFARVNAGLDEMAKRLTYMNEVRVRAMVDAAGQGLDRDAAHQYVQQAMTGAVDEAGKATDEAMLRAAERTTLTGQVGTDNNLAARFASSVQKLRHDYPLTRFILPVFSVPANSLGETLKRVPGVNLLPGMASHVADLAGDNGVVSQAEAHGRTLLGASFLTAGYLMNQAGLLTGSGPKNPADAKIWRQTHEPYSIRIGDTWVNYQKLDILGGLLSIPATLSDASVYHKADPGDLGDAALGAIRSLATWFKDQASMRTATQLLTLGDNPMSNPEKAMESLFGQVAGGMVSPGFLRTLGVDAVDPYVRMKRGWEDYVKAALPGMSEELEPLRNVLGEPVNRPNYSLTEAVLPITLAPVATYTKEPVLDELTRLYRRTGYSAGADPKALLYGYADPQDVKLEDGVSLYSHALQARATMQLDGMTLKQALGELIDSPEYNAAVDADSGQAVTSLGDPSRAYMVAQVFERYNKAIKADLASSSPTALRYMTAAAAKHRDDAYLSNVPIEDLVNNPGLYRANGIDPTGYQDKLTEGASTEPGQAGASADELLRALRGGSR